jgi:hypothetical protein
MAPKRSLLAILALLLFVGCASGPDTPAVEDQPDAAPSFFDMTDVENDEFDAPDPATCEHFFEWHSTHSYQKIINGMRMTELCTVTKCAKCNQIRHECQRRR